VCPYCCLQDGNCHFNKSDVGAEDVGFSDIPAGDENALKSAVASVGPVSVAIDASQSTFHFYSKGVYSDPKCSSVKLDHGVLVVGFGNEDGKDFWLIKNR
jgi:cathepsin L